MPSCLIPANTALYGFGIRLAFYISWIAIILADYVFTPSRSVRERAVTFILEFAVFIALAKQASSQSITGPEAYICSLLVSATLIFHIPALVWRGLCCWRKECDLALYSRWRNWSTTARNFLRGCRAVWVVGLCGWEFWFWSRGLKGLMEREKRTVVCPRYGFGFHIVRLDNAGFAIFHGVVYGGILGGSIYVALASMYNRYGERERRKKRRRWRRSMRSEMNDNASLVHLLRACLHMAVVVITILAVELAIRWNQIVDAYSVTTSGQMFPLLLSICMVIRVIWYQVKMTQNEVDTDSASSGSTDERRGRGRDRWPGQDWERGPLPLAWITTD